MDDRAGARARFLKDAGWASATARPLAGDASGRRYERLTDGDRRAVLMDADPALGEDTRPFCAIADHLRGLGFSAPEIFAAAPETGFLLLEDLGDALFARVATGRDDDALYRHAVDLLVALHDHPPPSGVPAMQPRELAALTSPAFEWYLPDDKDAHQAFAALFHPLVEKVWHPQPVLVLRDYHAENLIWLPGRLGVARVGLLDFQDALAGHRAYDLVSLLEDARRDVPPDLRARMIDHYVTKTGADAAAFDLACAVIATQRNLRILGVFARLCLHFGKPAYVDFIPRVWGHLMQDLAHPELAACKAHLCATLPEPTPAFLERMRAQCPTSQTH